MDDLIYDWNRQGQFMQLPGPVQVMDETVAEGLQSTSVRLPTVAQRAELVRLAAAARIDAINLGVVRNQARRDDVGLLLDGCRELRTCISIGLSRREAALAQGLTGLTEIRVHAAISDMVLAALGFELSDTLKRLHEAVLALHPTPVVWVIEDATRTEPGTLVTAFKTAQRAGIERIALVDSAGIAMPDGVCRLLDFVRREAPKVQWDWAGRNDRGLAVVNALAALSHGASRVCGTALGIGEGAGVIALDTLLSNTALMQAPSVDLVAIKVWCHEVGEMLGTGIPVNYPVLGEDAFRTATGVHAAAIVKARKKGDVWLADRVYSGIPAGWFGLSQKVDIGPMSGLSNVSCWLEDHQLAGTPDDQARILQRAKQSNRTLTEAEVRAVLQQAQPPG